MSRLVDTGALTARRIREPEAVAEAWAARRPFTGIPADGRLLVIAADHPARGALAVRGDRAAMASRPDLLERLATALSRPGVDGVLGTPDVLEDLLLAGLLDDRFTAFDAPTIAQLGLDGGKMLTRICLEDAGTAATLEASGDAVSALAAQGLMAMVEPFITVRHAPNRVENLLDPDSVISSIAVASGLGATSAHTWLKLPVVEDMERVLESTTLPCLLLGGDPTGDPEATYATWGAALTCPSAAGLVVGRALLYPPDGDVAGAVDTAAQLVHGGGRR